MMMQQRAEGDELLHADDTPPAAAVAFCKFPHSLARSPHSPVAKITRVVNKERGEGSGERGEGE